MIIFILNILIIFFRYIIINFSKRYGKEMKKKNLFFFLFVTFTVQ